MKAARDDTVYPCRAGARFASGRPFLDSYGLWVTGDVLYWTAYEGGTDISCSSSSGTNIIGTAHTMNFDWDVGYRLGAGWVTPNDNMEMSVLFTRIEPDGEYSQAAPAGGRVVSVMIPDNQNAQNATATWNLKCSTLDFEFGRSYFVSRYFYLRPFMGSRTAWIRQLARMTFKTPGTVYSHMRNDYVGGGLRLGADSKWFFARHWNLFTGVSASTLYGKMKVEQGVNQFATYASDHALTSRRIAVSAQSQIGLGWETSFSCDNNQIAVNIGYELNYWWRQNQLPAFENVEGSPYGMRRSEDLAFHGLTVDIQLSF
ncbi:MAG: hypothetical protein JSS32_08055 [Verrucomicrobia bacterium]|nr:hypothetical protein [Verrucomicrobiota bacterium]